MKNQSIENNIYLITSSIDERKALEIRNKSLENKANIQINEIKNDLNFLFYIYLDERDNYYSIISLSSKKCLGVEKITDGELTEICQYEISASPNLKWKIIKNLNSDFYEFQLKSNDLYLDLKYKDTTNGNVLQLFKKNDTNAQKFKLIKMGNIINANLNYEEIFKKLLESTPELFLNEENITKDYISNINKNNKNSFVSKLEIGNNVKNIEKDALLIFDKIELIKTHPKFIEFIPKQNLKTIIISEGVESILKNQFKNCFYVTKVILPKSIKYIEDYSFINLVNLKKIDCDEKWLKYFEYDVYTVPKTEKVLKKEIFQNWKSLKKLIIHDEIEEIEEGCFMNCESIEEIKLPNEIILIPENAFLNCKNLKKINIPNNVVDIHYSAFLGCNKLSEINYPPRLKPLFETVLEIKEEDTKKINSKDYDDYHNIESISISLGIEVNENFLSKFTYLKILSCDPNLLKTLDINIKQRLKAFIIPFGIFEISFEMFQDCLDLQFIEIPSSVEFIEDGSFISCEKITCVKCLPKFLYQFYKNKLETIFILEDTEMLRIDQFSYCTNLINIILPVDFEGYEKNLFHNCKKLMNIKYINGKKINYRTHCDIPEGVYEIEYKNFIGWNNLSSLTIPQSVIKIDKNTFKDCFYLNSILVDPLYIKYLYTERIEKIVIPEYVKKIDENYFKGCINLKILYCLGNENVFCGFNNCEEFNNIKLIKGYPNLFKSANEEIKKRLKFALLNEDCNLIDEYTFKNYINLVEIDLPEKVVFILNEAFANCYNLEKIEINENIEEIADDAFLNCKNLVKIKCAPKFLKIFEKNRIKEINLVCLNKLENDFEEINEIKDLINFKNLEKIEISSNIKFIPENTLFLCPNLTAIKCGPELLSNLNKKDKQYLKEIEISNVSKINDEIFEGLDNIYNIKIPPNIKIPERKKKQTSIEELEKIENNKKYCDFIRKIINEIKTGKIKDKNYKKNSLSEISMNISKVCLKIKNISKKKISPHPVQILTIIKLVDCLLNNIDDKYKKGAIAEVKTGEGKSYIIAVLAIILSKFYGKKIDVVTSTVELAKRDEEEQKEYYNLFKIGSGVLFNK